MHLICSTGVIIAAFFIGIGMKILSKKNMNCMLDICGTVYVAISVFGLIAIGAWDALLWVMR